MSAVELRGDELAVASSEVEAVRDLLDDGPYRDRLDGLLAGLESGAALGDDDVEELDRLLVLALQSGRIRALHGPGGEQAALRAYRKLPSGAELTASTAAVNEALASLAGRTLERISVTASGPGAFSIALEADGVELSVRLDRQGARIASVGV